MNQTQTNLNTVTLHSFGTPAERVQNAIASLKVGSGILVVDDENRENEGDLIFAAETLTTEQMALMIREGTGIVCCALTPEKLDKLELPQMVADNTSSMGTAFTVSIEAKEGVTTGVSAHDRVTTIKTAIKEDCQSEELARPGHVFPLRAHPGGVLSRAGHTEASLDFMHLAGLQPAAVLCELIKPNGEMARLPEICVFGKQQHIPVVTIADLISYLQETAQAA